MRVTSPSVNTCVKASTTIGATLPCTNLHYDMGEIQLAVHYEIEAAEGFVRLVDPMDQVQHLETEVDYEDILEISSRDCESIDLLISASRCDVAEARSPERILSQSIGHHVEPPGLKFHSMEPCTICSATWFNIAVPPLRTPRVGTRKMVRYRCKPLNL